MDFNGVRNSFYGDYGIDDLLKMEESKAVISMTPFQYRFLLGGSVASLCLALALLILNFYQQFAEANLARKQTELNNFRTEINDGAISQRLTQLFVADLTPMAESKPEIKSLLARYGVFIKKDNIATVPSPTPNP